MAEAGVGIVPIRPDLSGFQQAVSQEVEASLGATAKRMQNTGKSMFRSGRIMSTALTLPIVAGFKVATDAASDLNETLSKSEAIFGDATAAGINKWAKDAAKNLGQSRQQAIDAVATFGNLFVQLDIGSEQAAVMSKEMTKLASDFASFHNADISEVLMAQTAAFRGEYDALQRFVPTINAAAVEQEALRKTGKKTTKELTLQEKALAVQSLMMAGAGDATGDFARTAGGAANKQRILRAQMADASAVIGQKLLPVFTRLLGYVRQAVTWFSDLSEPMQSLILVGLGLLAALGPLVALIGAIVTAVGFLISPVGLVIVAVAALTAGVIYAYTHFGTFRSFVDGTWQVLQKVWDVVVRVGTAIFDLGKKVVQLWLDWTPMGQAFQHLPEILGFARDAFQWVIDKVKALIAWVKKLPGVLDKALGPLDEIAGKAADVAGKVGGAVGGVAGKVGGAVGNIPGFAEGGVVPGRLGSPQVILAHGGETVLPTHRFGFAESLGAGRPVELNIDARGVSDPGSLADYAARALGWRLGLEGGL